MAIVRPHGSRFSRHRPEPTLMVFLSMRPFSRLLLLSSFLMVFVNGISEPAEQSNGLQDSPARILPATSLQNVNHNPHLVLIYSKRYFLLFQDFSPASMDTETDTHTPKVRISFPKSRIRYRLLFRSENAVFTMIWLLRTLDCLLQLHLRQLRLKSAEMKPMCAIL